MNTKAMSNKMMTGVLVLFVGISAQAAGQIPSEKSHEMISALQTAGAKFRSIVTENVALSDFAGEVKCETVSNSNLTPSNPQWLLPTYSCVVAGKTLKNAKAKILFDVLNSIVGSDSAMGRSWTTAHLRCTVDLKQTSFDNRFSCSLIEI